MQRIYVPHTARHKWPKGHGSRCPKMPTDEPASLLQRAIAAPGVGGGKLWIASGRWCFCCHRSPSEGNDAWHGFPVIGGEVDERVLEALQAEGAIDARQRRRLRSQRALPDAWP